MALSLLGLPPMWWISHSLNILSFGAILLNVSGSVQDVHQAPSASFCFVLIYSLWLRLEISMPCVAEISILWPSYYASCKSGDWKGVWLVILLHAYGVDSVFPIELVFQDMFYSLWYCFFLAFCPYSCIKVLVAGLYFICPSNRSTP